MELFAAPLMDIPGRPPSPGLQDSLLRAALATGGAKPAAERHFVQPENKRETLTAFHCAQIQARFALRSEAAATSGFRTAS